MLNIRFSGPAADIARLRDDLRPVVARASDLSFKDNEDGSARLYLKFGAGEAAAILASFASAVSGRGTSIRTAAPNETPPKGEPTRPEPPVAGRYQVTWRR